jgi:nitric oxide reductase subunit B
MAKTQRLVYRFFGQTVILLMLYLAAALLSAVKFLSPNEPLALSLPYQQLGALSNVLLNLTALTGLIGGGWYLALSERADTRAANETLLRWCAWLWTAGLALAILAGLLNLLGGRHLLELPLPLSLLQLVAMLLILVTVFRAAPRAPLPQMWSAGLAVSIVCVGLSLLPTQDYLQDRLLRGLAVGLNLNVGYMLMALALGYWLMHRFSNLTPAWVNHDIWIAAGLVTLAGVWGSLPPLYRLGAPDWLGTLGSVGVIGIPILYLMIAARGYRALSDRNATYTLAGHWFALSVLLLLLGPGLLGGLAASPGIGQWTMGTRLSDLHSTLTALIPIAMTLGVINQAAAELRGQNWRITGLMPFWLVAFGLVGGALALGAAGVAQVYLERLAGVGYVDAQTLLIPLYTGWVFGLLCWASGVAIYALGFWLRRPVETSV